MKKCLCSDCKNCNDCAYFKNGNIEVVEIKEEKILSENQIEEIIQRFIKALNDTPGN